MTQSELIAAIAAKTNLAHTTVSEVLRQQGEIITIQLQADEEVTLPRLGKFSTQSKKGRTGRNPATGEEIYIEPKTVPIFKPSKALKEATKVTIPF